MLKKIVVISSLIFSVLGMGSSDLVFCADPPPEQTASGLEQQRKEIEKEEKLRKRVETEEEEKLELKEPSPAAIPPGPQEKTLVTIIKVTGVTLFKEEQIRKMISPFENKELTLLEIQEIVDLITQFYRQNGYVTSRAYLPPQKIQGGVLEIRVLEGKMGDVEIRGNRYFKTPLLKEKIKLAKGDPFNYNRLRKSLIQINEHPDRVSHAVLAPGKEPEQTDIILEIKDQRPIHVGFAFDNYGSRFIERNRYSANVSHNNLLGHDDTLGLTFLTTEVDAYKLGSINYLFPVTNDSNIGFFAAVTDLALVNEFESAGAKGESTLLGVFLNKILLVQNNWVLRGNAGFDYKDMKNSLGGTESSRDELRIAKASLDFDRSDRFGRTLVTGGIDLGIPEVMGGLNKKDPKASRAGAGGKFVKWTVNALRLQRMFWESILLWRNQAQMSGYALAASEQIQIGGISNVRGYPPAEHSGDRGYTTTLEWSFPPYGIPKSWEVPFSKTTFYQGLRTVLFYDLGTVRLKRPGAGEQQDQTLKALGFGFQMNLVEDFSARIDLGYPLGHKTPSDGDHLHSWLRVSKTF